MMSSTLRRLALNKAQIKNIEGVPSVACRFLHQTPTPQSEAEVKSVPNVAEVPTAEVKSESTVMNRFVVTGETMVSKIFPAGFGWQSSSIIAENHLGYSADSMAFALTTGFGDAVGVLLGHCGYFAIKKAVTNNDKIIMKREFDTGVLLASAAFCSGSLWQPLVDALQGSGLSFAAVFTGTWIGCGTAFYAGLRAGRTILPSFLSYVAEPTYENSKTDASLSIAIGGATGYFVGTDAAYLPEQNFLIDMVGIHDTTPALAGCTIAGSSTALGFGVSQTAMNVVYPSGKCWND
jgi:hypothetical protein